VPQKQGWNDLETYTKINKDEKNNERNGEL
jgi:hypothetical protein